jgi:hypothetical protein
MDQYTPDDEYDGLLAAGAQNQSYQAEMEKQKALAARLRSGPALEGQMVSGHYVAPNALEIIGDVMNQKKANAADAAHTAATAGLGSSMASQNDMILRALRRNQGAQKPAVPSGMPTEPYDY